MESRRHPSPKTNGQTGAHAQPMAPVKSENSGAGSQKPAPARRFRHLAPLIFADSAAGPVRKRRFKSIRPPPRCDHERAERGLRRRYAATANAGRAGPAGCCQCKPEPLRIVQELPGLMASAPRIRAARP
ncbi:MAG: hypothetical protein GMKNLPBB_03103 [Myxococcota bacterium]|nr:hypothetical protein [Myxococcota bacterium]